LEQWASELSLFLSQSHGWAGPIVFGLAFAESLACLSLFVPFTAMIVAAGPLVGAGMLDGWLIVPWGIAGACLGDAVSYWVGRYLGRSVPRIWPFCRNPDLIDSGEAFFRRWGVLSVFLGRFFGPLRAVVPLVAGMLGMPQARFQVANIGSAIVWLPLLLLPGAVATRLFEDVPQFGEKAFVYVFFSFLVFPLALALCAWLRKRRRA